MKSGNLSEEFVMRMDGKIALITGASSGIGLAAMRQLAKAGATVIGTGRDVGRLQEALAADGIAGAAMPCDVRDTDDIARLVARVGAEYGRIDVLLANAGVSDAPPIGKLTPKGYSTLMDVNCRGATFTFVHALPLLADGASVVFTGSVAGRKGQPGDPLYAGSKGFIRAFARSAGTDRDLLSRRIRVNVVSPGPIETPMTRKATENEDIRAWVAGLVPMGRWGQADEVAEAILFLASDAARFITGTDLTVDGGMSHA
jgi:NAD(P)-dependent dehydrogenase (short-subunit alcohol dehydrogenase family)